jgi:hypothetical protein
MIAKMVYVQCDGCGDPAPMADDAKEARATAKSLGYIRTKGRDICPRCKGRR